MDTKPWFLSKTIIGAIITGLAPLLTVFGVHLPVELQAQLTDAVILAITAGGAILTVVGRITATKAIGKAGPPPSALALLIALTLPMALGACAFQEAETPAQKVFAIQSDYATAQTAALAYLESDHANPVTAHVIRFADNVAMDAITAAQQAVRRDAEDPRVPALIAAARQAVTKLHQLVPVITGDSRAPPGAG